MPKINAILIVTLSCVSFIAYTQYNRINQLKGFNESLAKSEKEIREEKDRLKDQYNIINEALTHVAEQKEKAEAESNTLRNNLKSAQRGNSASRVPVPADVIRMQKSAIDETNRKFTAAGSTNRTVSTP